MKPVYYEYSDAGGVVQFRVKRWGGKNFSQESVGPDGKWHRGLNGERPTLYRLPEVRRAVREGRPVYIVEGEKDVETARQLGVCATCNPGGAGKWRTEFSEHLEGADVYVVFDRDKAGRRHALEVGASLAGVARSVDYLYAAAGKDLTDHVEAGFDFGELKHGKPKISADSGSPTEQSYPSQELPAAFQLALNRLRGVVVESGKEHQYNARCPAHDDSRASLSIRLGQTGDRAILVHCHAEGCSKDKIARALGIDAREFSYISEAVSIESPVHAESRGVRLAYERLTTQARARALWQADQIKDVRVDYPLDGSISWDVMAAEPEVPVKFVVDELAHAGSNILLAAEQKTGKTRFALNLVKSLCDGVPFLGYFPVDVPDGARVLYLNYEMPVNVFNSWVRQARIIDQERLSVLHLKGRMLPIWDDAYVRELAPRLAADAIWMIIFDTQLAAARGFLTTENNSMEWFNFQARIDELKSLSGVECTLFLHHMGKMDKEHGRGSSRIEDWPDDLWYLSGVENASSDREFRSRGRSDAYFAGVLGYDEATAVYSYVGTSKEGRAEEKKLKRMLSYVYREKHDGGQWPTYSGLIQSLPEGRHTVRKLVEVGERMGLLERVRIASDGVGGRPGTHVCLTSGGHDWLGVAHVS